jgi:hypothetical protein
MIDSLDDFMSATTAIQARRSRLQKLKVKVPGGLLLPVAPPSPISGINGENEVEPFPEYVDPCPPVKAEPLHCVLHCKHDICKLMIKFGKCVLPCRCGDEVAQEEPVVTTPLSKGPIIALDETIFATIQDIESDINADQTIEIQREYARLLIEQFELYMARRILQNEGFMATMCAYAPRMPDRAARAIVADAFKLISLHIERAMQDVDSRKVTPRDLHAELKLYLWTGLEEWIDKYSRDPELREILGKSDPRLTLEAANFGLAGAVSKLWTECLDDVVRLFIWRDAKVQKCKVKQSVFRFGLGALSMRFIVASLSHACWLWWGLWNPDFRYYLLNME